MVFDEPRFQAGQASHKSYWLMNLTWALLIGIVHDFLLKTGKVERISWLKTRLPEVKQVKLCCRKLGHFFYAFLRKNDNFWTPILTFKNLKSFKFYERT